LSNNKVTRTIKLKLQSGKGLL